MCGHAKKRCLHALHRWNGSRAKCLACMDSSHEQTRVRNHGACAWATCTGDGSEICCTPRWRGGLPRPITAPEAVEARARLQGALVIDPAQLNASVCHGIREHLVNSQVNVVAPRGGD